MQVSTTCYRFTYRNRVRNVELISIFRIDGNDTDGVDGLTNGRNGICVHTEPCLSDRQNFDGTSTLPVRIPVTRSLCEPGLTIFHVSVQNLLGRYSFIRGLSGKYPD